MPRIPCMLLRMIVALVTLISPSLTPADEPATAVPGTGVTVAETEDNDHVGVADPLHLGDNAAGAIAPGGESDFYRFFARAGTTIRAETFPGTVFDLMLTLYDSDGTTVLQCDDDDGPGAAALIESFIAADGTYFIEVKAFLISQTGTYTLQLRQVDVSERTGLDNHWRDPFR